MYSKVLCRLPESLDAATVLGLENWHWILQFILGLWILVPSPQTMLETHKFVSLACLRERERVGWGWVGGENKAVHAS